MKKTIMGMSVFCILGFARMYSIEPVMTNQPTLRVETTQTPVEVKDHIQDVKPDVVPESAIFIDTD
nr:MetaGeneMark_Unknown Function [uncultured bacterium]